MGTLEQIHGIREFKDRLLAEKLVDSDQYDEARECAEERGGHPAVHLFRLGYVGEADLVRILGDQPGVQYVALSGRDIPRPAIDKISHHIAWSETVLPFVFDPWGKRLGIACLDPHDDRVRQMLSEACPDIEIELFIALEPTLRSAIAREYRQPVAGEPVADEPASEEPTESELALETLHQSMSEQKDVDLEGDQAEQSGICRLLVLSGNTLGERTVGLLLKHQGYKVDWTDALEPFLDAQRDVPPDILLILAGDSLSPLPVLLEELSENGIDLAAQPSFLISSDLSEAEVVEMLRLGFEDVVPVEKILDLLMIKLSKVRNRLKANQSSKVEILSDLGTHGSLADLNAIDLLQAMGRTCKTVRVNITGSGCQLTVTLDMGRIIHAECGDLLGPEAIYACLAWEYGVWSVDPIPEDALPLPNIVMTNETILLEGCRRLDEQRRRSQHDATGEAESNTQSVDLNTMFDNLQ